MKTNPFIQYGSKFQDLFDVDYFITSLRDEVRILKDLPKELKIMEYLPCFFSMPPASWSNMSYYYQTVGSQLLIYHC